MVDINEETIEYLATLSKISVSQSDTEKLLDDLKKILSYIDQLNEVDTEGVKPCNHILENHHHLLREDEVGELLPRDTFLKNAPSHLGGMIKVPQVIKPS